MRCDQCSHWQEPTSLRSGEAKRIGFGLCRGVRERWDIRDTVERPEKLGREEAMAYAAAQSDALKAAQAYVEDGSEYYAGLLTAPDFFCALFKGKTA